MLTKKTIYKSCVEEVEVPKRASIMSTTVVRTEDAVSSTRIKTSEITAKLMNHVTLGWCNDFLTPKLTLTEFVAQMEELFARFLNGKFHAAEKSDHDLIKEFVGLCEMIMPTKTNPEPAYVFCDYCWDPGTHTVKEMELCKKTRRVEEAKIKKAEEEEEEARLMKELQHKKWEEQERRKHHETIEKKRREQQQRAVEVRVKCAYCTSGELHTQKEVVRCLETFVNDQKKEML